MTTKVDPAALLLNCGDGDFDTQIKTLPVKDLMTLISSLQKEMTKEQENFNSLSTALQGLRDRNSRQHKTISKDMQDSQKRLTLLMNRSMKCFSQQNLQRNNSGAGTNLQRRNSASKTADSASASPTKPVSVHRSRSMHSIAQPNNAPNPTPVPANPTPGVYRGGGGVMSRVMGNRVEVLQQRPASVVGVVNGVEVPKAGVTRVNGVPTTAVIGGRSQGQYIKRTAAPKASGIVTTSSATTNGQTELEKVHARLRSTRNMDFSTLPDRPASGLSHAAQNGNKEVTYFRTNLDRMKSSSSIVLGQMSEFEDDRVSSSSKPSQSPQAPSPMRRAQSREELYATESRTRSQKNALLQEIQKRRVEPEPDSKVDVTDVNSSLWGLKGQSLLSQRLQEDEKGQTEYARATQNAPSSSSKVTMHIQPSLPHPDRRGLAVSIKSTSRENLADIKPSHISTTTTNIPPVTSAVTRAATGAAADPEECANKIAPAANPAQGKAAAAQAARVAPPGRGQEQPASDEDDVDEEAVPRMNLMDWDPRPVLDSMYKITLAEETAEDISFQYISMEGLMEKLPMNKKKSTLLKTWKRRFFKAQDGWIQYFEAGHRDKPSETLQLMGGRIDDMGNRILGVDDGRGHYLMVRAPTDKEYGQWKVALESQTADNTKATYVQPVLRSPPHPSKRVVVIDMGSGGIRAGILGEKESLPQVFFPSVVAVDKETGKLVVGKDAYRPDVRKNATLLHPIRPSNKVDQFNIDVVMMTAIFGKVFSELAVDPTQFMVMLSTPQTLSDSLRAGLMNALVDKMGAQGVCMVQQSLLALYSYRTTTGIIVDIGHRIEILPIYDGFVLEGGVARCPYGSTKVVDSLKKSLLETNYKFASDVELLLVRHIMEQCCYVAYNYSEDEALCTTQSGKLNRSINLSQFNLPEGAYKSVQVEEGRFSSPEGFFNVDLWEMDYPTLHKLIFQAIQSCPMDNRRHMYRAVYLSGGVTMLPGFPERLHAELRKLAPPAVTVEVHAAPNRYHAAYVGACSVAGMSQFRDMAITQDEWRREGVRAFRKWQANAS